MIQTPGVPDPASWQETENRKNCIRIVGLIVLALIVLGVIGLIIYYVTHRGHHHHIPQIVRHQLMGLKHQAQNIGSHLFSR